MFKINANSPPGNTISVSVPPHAVFGLESASDSDEKKGGLHLNRISVMAGVMRQQKNYW